MKIHTRTHTRTHTHTHTHTHTEAHTFTRLEQTKQQTLVCAYGIHPDFWINILPVVN